MGGPDNVVSGCPWCCCCCRCRGGDGGGGGGGTIVSPFTTPSPPLLLSTVSKLALPQPFTTVNLPLCLACTTSTTLCPSSPGALSASQHLSSNGGLPGGSLSIATPLTR